MRRIIHERMATKQFKGIIEFVLKDKLGRVIKQWSEPNIVKIFAKEILSHRLAHSRVWDPTGGSGSGTWVDSGIDPNNEFSAKYVLLGASYDADGVPLDTNDIRYYTIDPITGKPVPIRLDVGADYDGELINSIPLADPTRPLKRVENIAFETTYQPSGTPFLQPEVRALNNIVLLETTVTTSEYNGFGVAGSSGSSGSSPGSDYFTITEVALAAGPEMTTLPKCEIKPRQLFLQGVGGAYDGASIPAVASGGDTITISDPTDATIIKEGDQVKIVAAGGSADDGFGSEAPILNQIDPYYLVVSKQDSGSDVQLDRVPVNSSNVPITGAIGVLRNTLRIFSHRILTVPVKKTSDVELLIRWRIIFS